MLLSIIIPSCNRNNLLRKCLQQLTPELQTINPNEFEIIVSDDSRENVAKEFIEQNFPSVRWEEGSKRGPAANRNNGASYAKGDWLVFTDDDCLPAKDWLQNFFKAIDSDVKVLEGKTISDRDQERFDEHSPINMKGGNLWSCNFAIKRDFFLSLGGFDEKFPYPAMEDTDLFSRIQKLTKVYFINEAVVIHPWRLMKPFSSYKKWYVSHQYFYKKHRIKKNLAFRWSRMKILIHDFFSDFKKLASFNFKGTAYFFEKTVFNILMVIA